MKNLSETEIYEMILFEDGFVPQLNKCIEEMGKLSIEISKCLSIGYDAIKLRRHSNDDIRMKILEKAIDVRNTLNVIFREYTMKEYLAMNKKKLKKMAEYLKEK